jgi:hypothetical protein
MSTIMSRSGAEFWWKTKLPRHIAYLHKPHSHSDWIEVTYKEILDKKIEQQKWELQIKTRSNKIKPCYIWVFNNDYWLMGGWYLYIKTLKEDYALNFRNPNKELTLKIMELYPCGVIPVLENFDSWAEAFSKTFSHKGFKRKKNQGLLKCFCELNEYNELKDIVVVNSNAKS